MTTPNPDNPAGGAGFQPLGEKLYQRAGRFYGRFTLADGRRKWHPLAAKTLRHARQEIAQLETRHKQAAAGIVLDGRTVPDPFAKHKKPHRQRTLDVLLAAWRKLDCPDIKRRPRTAARLREIDIQLPHLKLHLGHREPETLAVRDCMAYFDARTTASTSGKPLRRSVDLELTTLSNCLHWAASLPTDHGGIRYNPLAKGRPRFQEGKDTRNAREVMPASGDQFHALANWNFSSQRSEVFGWMILIMGLTGARIGEIRLCRWDARRHNETHIEPGYLNQTDLYIRQEKARGRAQTDGHHVRRCPLVDPELPDHCPSRGQLPIVLDKLRAWHRHRYPDDTPWMFPGRTKGEPISETALNQALRNTCRNLNIQHITPHGLRAFYTTVMRRWRVADGLIASRLGQVSGEQLIQRIYGHDIGNIDPGMDWLPTGEEPIAWHAFDHLTQPQNIIKLRA